MAKIKNLNYHWKNFNLIIPQWEFSDTDITAVWGASGSGKSTLLQIMAGLINCPKLEFTINDAHYEKLKPGDRHFGYVFQDYALFPHLTSWENIIFPAEAKGISKSIWGDHAENLLNTLDIEKVKNQKVSSLSGGEQQRVALARALVLKPKLVLMDEPFSALDENLKEQARGLVVKLNKQYKVPFIIVSHDPRDVKALSQNLLILKRGTVKAQGKTSDLLNELA